MIKSRRKYYFIAILFASFFILSTSEIYANSENIKSISVVMDDNYPPYSFRDSDGNLQGITIDQWKLFQAKTGIKPVITGMEWSKAYSAMNNSEFDVIDTISYNVKREKAFDYTEPYATIDVPIFSQKNISGITNVESLKGFTVGAKKGDNSIDILKKNGITNIIEYNSAEDIVKAAKKQKLVIFVLGKSPGLYYLYKMQIQDNFNYSSSLYTSEFYRAVKKGDTNILNVINEGFSTISKAEYKSIDEKWFGKTESNFYKSKIFKFGALGIIGIILFALLLIVWNRLLHRKVKQKTKELYDSIEELKNSESRSRALLEAVPDMFILVNRDGKIIDYNSMEEKIKYFNKENYINKNVCDILPSEICMQINFLINQDYIIEKVKTIEYCLNIEGCRRDFEARLVGSRNNTVVGIIRDITKRKQMEQKLESLGYQDQLTGLYNRRFFEKEVERLDLEENLPLTIVMADVNGLKLVNDSFGHAVGDGLLKVVAEVILRGCRAFDIVARLGGDEFVILLCKTDIYETEQIIKKIQTIAQEEKVGSVDISVSFGYATKNSMSEKTQEVFKKAEDHMYKRKIFEGPSMRGKTINTIIKTLHEKNKREEQHSHRVSSLCESMGRAIGLNEVGINELKTVGLLHDIGKIAIDENILNKPGKLDEGERDEIERHPEIGYRILSTVNDMSEMAEYILAHHEKLDGSGYPKGLEGEKIPLQSRIIAIADAYDAMTSERSYRSALSEEIAVAELQKYAGTQFDAELIEVFVEKVLGKHT
ncbi:HD domain-containing phosphohydrolase [Clostridium sp. FP1]|uniref:HD domain-containing phosphohydrolase n=1 Tax=Clostridium sp. FP1 TaxID=2724076 RepID=UPI001CCB4AF7|nr:HD domain-containing phosphohydrolase [Clostridium sp. FP1]MBZ9633803.1 transporter substrate-binding domain-containing protein [Clostridium sp. FP1]